MQERMMDVLERNELVYTGRKKIYFQCMLLLIKTFFFMLSREFIAKLVKSIIVGNTQL